MANTILQILGGLFIFMLVGLPVVVFFGLFAQAGRNEE